MTEVIQSHVMVIASTGLTVDVDPIEEVVRMAFIVLEGVDLIVEWSCHFLTIPIGEPVVLGTDQRPVVHLLLDFEDEAGGPTPIEEAGEILNFFLQFCWISQLQIKFGRDENISKTASTASTVDVQGRLSTSLNSVENLSLVDVDQ